MRKFLIAIALFLSSPVVIAVSTCDTMPTKYQKVDCWSNLIGSYQHEVDDYAFAVQESKKVPMAVKRNVELKRQAIPKDAAAQCPKDSYGYPQSACYIGVMEKFKDYTYHQTYRWGVPDMRLN